MFFEFLKFLKFRIYEVLYIVLLGILSVYIIVHWEECICMNFFDQFDGNNILFLVWIVSIILSFYDVEAKGWKFRRKGIEDTLEKYANADFDYRKNMINIQDNIQPRDSKEMNGGISQ